MSSPLHTQCGHNDWLCSTGKLGFRTRRGAKQRARRIRNGGHLRPYLCGECQLWHLGHLPLATAYGLLASEAVYSERRA